MSARDDADPKPLGDTIAVPPPEDLEGRREERAPDRLQGPRLCEAGCGQPAGERRVQSLGRIEIRPRRTCEACEILQLHAEYAEALRRAWATVPRTLEWVRLFDSPGHKPVAEWARDAKALGATRDVARALGSHPLVTFAGPPGAGKTTLMCALFREWIRRGARDKSTHARYRARRARYVVAPDLVRDVRCARLGEHVPSVDLARTAAVLAIDEVGRGKDPQGVVFDLLHERHRDGLITLIATPLQSAAEVAEVTGDGGLGRRLFDDATVIRVEKR